MLWRGRKQSLEKGCVGGSGAILERGAEGDLMETMEFQ